MTLRPMRIIHRNHGVALLTALLVVALVTVAAVSMVSRQQLDIRRTGNILEADRLWQVALGVEAWAIGQLARDDASIDHLDEDWAKPLPATPLDGGGTVSGSIIDLQSRYNLNNLVNANVPDQRPDGQPPDPRRPVNLNKQRMINLLQALELDPVLVSPIIDWVDSDSNPQSSGGAEDSLYSSRSPAYRTANSALASVTELRLMEGIDEEAYTALQGQVAALPEEVPINVNTAGAEVLRAILPELSALEAEGLVDERRAAPFEDVQAFISRVQQQAPSSKGLAVNSRYFQVTGIARSGSTQLRLTSILHRDEDKQLRVLYRSRSEF